MDKIEGYEEFTSLTYEEAQAYLEERHQQRVRDVIADRICPLAEGLVADLGCGPGIDAKRYPGGRYVGIDMSPALIQVAKERNPDHGFGVRDLRDTRVSNKHFRYSFLKSTLEHVHSEADAIAIYQEAIRITSETLFVAWHTPPQPIPESRIVPMLGHFGKDIFQNTYAEKVFFKIRKPEKIEQVDNFTLWEIAC